MSALPAITVVTPCLNAAPTLPEALASVRAQGYPRLEHVVVDGGSSDGTLDILRAAERVRWISEPDRGLAHAMNKGIAMAQGEVIGWLNADDRYLPRALEAVGRALARHPDALWLTGRCRIIDADGREVRRWVTAYKNAFLRRYSLPLYLTQNFISAPATFLRREAFEVAGLFDERYRISMDYDFYLRLARRADPLVLDRELADFRMAEGSLSMSGFETQFREHSEQARRHGAGHPVAVAVNQLSSRLIVLVYRAMRAMRRRRELHAG
ncbi:MAG TPA: glycosyltransferase family 2 protein [Solirubrobacteraceae bacterium]|nr:glycosyltransferase family 2 protein [Solirubrobacteraceae bacterium]